MTATREQAEAAAAKFNRDYRTTTYRAVESRIDPGAWTVLRVPALYWRN